MPKIKIVTNLKHVELSFRKLPAALSHASEGITLGIASVMAENIKLITYAHGNYWKGGIETGTRAIKMGKDVGIVMPQYGLYLEAGTAPRGSGFRGYPRLKEWAYTSPRGEDFNYWGLINSMCRYGTKPHPFIDDAWRMTEANNPGLIKDKIDIAFKDAGWKVKV